MALMKKLTSAIVASSLVLGLVGTAGATTPDKVQTAADRMLKLALINGVTPGAPSPDLALNANLTRAQLVTILVRAFGQEGNAKFLNGAASFPDAANHPWASGYIAMAKQIIAQRTAGREVVGMPDGTFNPDGNVTAGEAVAFLMKFVGAPQDSTLAWPDNYIQGAANAGLITAEDKAVLLGVKNAPATRGLSFYLADRTFYGYKLAEGGTTYTTFVDNTKPALTVDAVPATTLEEQVIVTGTVASDAVAVHVGSMDNAATVANGKFTATVKLTAGENKILVHAVDLAGNASEQTVTVSRTAGAAATIDAADITVGAGQAVDVKAAVKDAKGNEVVGAEITGAITGETPVGTYAAGKFTAGEKTGVGTLTLKSGELTKEVKVTVVAGAMAKVEGETSSVAPGKALKLIAKDKFGNTVTGATFSKGSEGGVVDGDTFIAAKTGSYTVKATKGDVTVEGKIGVFGKAAKLVATAPQTVVANGSSNFEVKVSAVDKEGNVVTDFEDQISYDNATAFTDKNDVTPGTKNGVAVFTFRADPELADSIQDITFTARDSNGNKLGLTEGTVSIEAVAQKATSISIEAPEYLPTNVKDAAQEVTVKVKDQAGKTMKSGSWDMDVTISGPARLEEGGNKSGSVSLTTAANTFKVLPDERGGTGNVDITVAFAGLTTGKATMKAAFASNATALKLKAKDDPASIKVASLTTAPDDEKNYAEYTVNVVDKNGVPVTDDRSGTVRVNVSDFTDTDRVFVQQATRTDTGWAWGTPFTEYKTTANRDVVAQNGEAKFRIATDLADSAFKVAVSDPTGSLTSAAALALATDSADPAVVAFAHSGLTMKTAENGTGKVTAQLYDAFGNKAAVSGVKLTFSSNTYDQVELSGESKDVSVRTDKDGQAAVDVYITAGANAPVITVTGDYGSTPLKTFANKGADWKASGKLYDDVTVKMAERVVKSIAADWLKADGSAKAPSYTVGSGSVTLRLTVKDNFNRLLVGLTADDFQLTFNDSDVQKSYDDGTVSVTAGTDDGEYLVTGIQPVTSGTLTVTAAIASQGGDVKVTRSIAVKAGGPADIRIAESTATVSVIATRKILVETGKVTAFTINLRDAEGNVVDPASVPTAVTVALTESSADADATNGKAKYLDFRDASGASISSITIPAGRATGKFYVVTNEENGKITLNAAGGVTFTATYVVNPK